MITCEQCGKINGRGEVGSSWICEDCKVSENKPVAEYENDKE
jgi:hypothetical protein